MTINMKTARERIELIAPLDVQQRKSRPFSRGIVSALVDIDPRSPGIQSKLKPSWLVRYGFGHCVIAKSIGVNRATLMRKESATEPTRNPPMSFSGETKPPA